MNQFLTAIALHGMATTEVAKYAEPHDQKAATEAVLRLSAEYARNGVDYTVLTVLEYPDTDRANITKGEVK